ncbi:metallophosphoesterase family protein [Frankia sp. AgB1.9]|uniref:purple acid phosphatase family protein n=1 Tax=unclassified Frankia TaxID=2632575 RepID=UPI001932C459|nr:MULTISPECIES: metallophosphoesterase family protein [unclassified Frankia]MBL7492576.1 metallophosphoesterase family protein [Frankia sp. AgW1.1]MBL7548729.1 metallophosphoesterase family protein [Frankia sp. AgB1.9]MBL7619327.1 metallophosphoesterase family protein [Frankia sp. AgB1.8]
MPCRCHVTRRDLLLWSALIAAAPLVACSDPDESAARATAAATTAGVDPRTVSPVNLELVTLTETSAVITWYTGIPGTDDGTKRLLPQPADGQISYGTSPSRLTMTAHDKGGLTPYHYVELTGLEPGQTYYYRAASAGKTAAPTPLPLVNGNAAGTAAPAGADGPFVFTTPQPPAGRHLFSIALCNDLHLGETVAGLVGGTTIKGISQQPGLPKYPEIMLEGLVSEATARGANYLLAAGDISSEARTADVSRARTLLDRFGTYRQDYFVARGNHDRAHVGADYAACSPGEWQGNDCFRDDFFGASTPTYFSHDLHGLHVVGLDTYDKAGNGGDAGGMSPAQRSWLAADLKAHRDQPTIVFGHHPLVVNGTPFGGGPSSMLDATQANDLLSTYASTPGVFLHHAGHTHRNHRTVSQAAPRVVLQEVCASKEYPGGFSLLRVHSGGYALNFYKSRTDLARQWSERSRQELSGLWPQFSLGAAVSDRNSVATRDLSGLTPA